MAAKWSAGLRACRSAAFQAARRIAGRRHCGPAGWKPALLCILILAPVCRAAEENVLRAVDSFVEALCVDDLAAFEPMTDVPLTHNNWRVIRELLETSRSIRVRSFHATIEHREEQRAVVRLDLDATRLTRGALEERVAVPSSWILEIVCGSDACRVHSVETREHATARALIAMAPVDRERVIQTSDANMHELVMELANEAIFVNAPTEANLAFIRELAARNGDLAGESNLLRTFSMLLRNGGQDAVPAAMEALAIAQRSGDPDAIAGAIHAAGTARAARGEVAGGLEDLRVASSMLDRLRDPRIALKALAMRSLISYSNGALRDSLQYAQQLIEESTRYGWTEGQSSAEIYLGLLHHGLGAQEVARTYLESSYRKALASRDARNELFTLFNLGGCEVLLEDYDAAIDHYRRAIRFSPEMIKGMEPMMRSALGTAYLRAGRLAEAEEMISSAIDCARNLDMTALSEPLAVLGELRLAQGRPQEALDAANQVRVLASEAGDSWPVDALAGRALKHLGRIGEAETAFRSAIERIEATRSQLEVAEGAATRYFDDKTDPYAELAELLATSGRAAEALELSEQMRARTLAVVLEQGKIDISATMEPAEKERERELNERLAELNGILLENPKNEDARKARDAARLDLDRFRDELFVSHPAVQLRRALRGAPIAIPDELADTLIVEYIVRDHGVLAITARRARDGRMRNSARFIPVSSSRLATLVNSFLEALAHRDAGYREHARTLYDLLLGPIEKQMHARKRVCVIPDGVLWKLPFHALVDREERHVIERMPLFYAASVRTLAFAAAHAPRKGLRPLLALGDPRLSKKAAANAVAFQRDAETGPLPDAQKEVEAIRALYPAKTTKVLVGAEATEDTFKREAAKYQVLHLAAHALFDERAPMYSALLLSSTEDGREDGFLEAREIADLTLNSEVAILSACDTARGRYGAGEGLIGMSWALQVAGCPTAIVSQWKVASAPTAQLMIAFHRNLIAGTSKVESLRRASLELMRTRAYAHPYYWSPFVLVGSP